MSVPLRRGSWLKVLPLYCRNFRRSLTGLKFHYSAGVIPRLPDQLTAFPVLFGCPQTKIAAVIATEISAQNDFTAKMRAAGGTTDKQAMMDKMTEIRNATTEALKSILKPAQFELYTAMPRGGRGGGGGRSNN